VTVFEDLRVGEPAKAVANSELAALIARTLRARRLTQAGVAKLLGIDQPNVSELLRRGSGAREVTLGEEVAVGVAS